MAGRCLTVPPASRQRGLELAAFIELPASPGMHSARTRDRVLQPLSIEATER